MPFQGRDFIIRRRLETITDLMMLKAHEARFRALYEKVVNKTVFVREDEQEWKCGNCGWVTKGTTPPDMCPACAHPKSHFRIKDTNY